MNTLITGGAGRDGSRHPGPINAQAEDEPSMFEYANLVSQANRVRGSFRVGNFDTSRPESSFA